MESFKRKLEYLQQEIAQKNSSSFQKVDDPELLFTEVAGLFHIAFNDEICSDSFDNLMNLLCEPESARLVKSLSFSAPDEGVNGTKNWDFSTLIKSKTQFPNLLSFNVEPTKPEHHNQTIIGVDYEEDGMISELVVKMPILEMLTVPSAPDQSFFSNFPKTLTHLRIDTGYDHQDFILNLSRITSLNDLQFLDFGDYHQTYLENYQVNCVPLEHYQELFASVILSKIGFFRLRNPSLTDQQLKVLHSQRGDLQLHIVRTSSYYMS